MLALPSDLLGRDVDLGTVEVTPDRLRAYAAAVGDRAAGREPFREAPLGFALALRGGPVPEVDLPADTISVHGGHVITAHHPLTAPRGYALRARVTDVFEKSGRSGPLIVIVRRAEIRASDGALVATVDDQQIVRWRPPDPAGLPAVPAAGRVRQRRADARSDRRADAPDLEVGGLVALQHRRAPSATAIATYARSLGGRAPLFTDRTFARSLGYADVIVPGPLQSALLEALVRQWLPGWTLHRLSLTFRLSLTAREPIALSVVVIEHRRHRAATALVCDLSLENRDGERAALGMVELTRNAAPGTSAAV